MGLFSSSSDDLFLGIDIGDSSIKMVELKRKGKGVVLSNYAFSENVSQTNFTKIEDIGYLAAAIGKIRDTAGIKAKKVTASLPTFSVFSSIIHLASLDKKNMEFSIKEEAKKVIPLPMEDMILDWKIIGEDPDGGARIFLTGSPKKLVRKYIDIFSKSKLSLASLETETFSLVRALLGDDKSTVMIAEIGANSTDLSIVKESIPMLNRSLEVCGATVTDDLAKSLGMSQAQAEQLKFDLSVNLSASSQDRLAQVIVKSLEPIVQEIEYMLDFWNRGGNSPVEKIVLSGGGSLLLNLSQYLSERLNMNVLVGDPWNRVSYSPDIKMVMDEIGPKLAVAIGLAMREIY
jgi:type IV pilus assembly protein PilM